MEFSLIVEYFHRRYGIQHFGDHVFVNWGINLFVLFFVVNVFPEVSLLSINDSHSESEHIVLDCFALHQQADSPLV